jgi:hypothetical protein
MTRLLYHPAVLDQDLPRIEATLGDPQPFAECLQCVEQGLRALLADPLGHGTPLQCRPLMGVPPAQSAFGASPAPPSQTRRAGGLSMGCGDRGGVGAGHRPFASLKRPTTSMRGSPIGRRAPKRAPTSADRSREAPPIRLLRLWPIVEIALGEGGPCGESSLCVMRVPRYRQRRPLGFRGRTAPLP